MATSQLGEFLKSINSSKENVIRDSDAPDVAAKSYPFFPVARSLSYFSDCVLFVNELNARGLSEFHITNTMHYEFLLHVLPKGKRFAKWAKRESDKHAEAVAEYYGCSKRIAQQYAPLLSQQQLKVIYDKIDKGGRDG